jgi:hypothetical protein
VLHKRSPARLNAISEASSTPPKNLSEDSNPVGSKRVKFDKVVMRAEYEKGSQEDPSEKDEDSDSESSSDSSDQGSDEEMANINSDPEEMNSGRFFEHISYETKRAEKERKLLLTHLKSKHIAGSIFFD